MSNWFSKHYLRSLASRLKKKGWYADILEFDWIDFDRNTYLIRFGHDVGYNRGSQPMLLMGDFGVTWEPAKVHSTETFTFIKGNNPDKDVDKMIKTALKYYKDEDEIVKKVTTWQMVGTRL